MRGSSVRIRLQRFGRPHRPFYRIVACKRDAPRDGKFLEILGSYDPIPDINGNKQVTLKADAIKKWMIRGAEPSERMAKILAAGELLPPVPRRALLRDHSLLMPTEEELSEAVQKEVLEEGVDGDAATSSAMEIDGEGAEQPRT